MNLNECFWQHFSVFQDSLYLSLLQAEGGGPRLTTRLTHNLTGRCIIIVNTSVRIKRSLRRVIERSLQKRLPLRGNQLSFFISGTILEAGNKPQHVEECPARNLRGKGFLRLRYLKVSTFLLNFSATLSMKRCWWQIIVKYHKLMCSWINTVSFSTRVYFYNLKTHTKSLSVFHCPAFSFCCSSVFSLLFLLSCVAIKTPKWIVD